MPEIRTIFKGAYRCYIKIPHILFDNKISDLPEEKIMIQIDTYPYNFNYKPEKKILNKFEIFTQINVTPLDILLSQKIYAILNRKRDKGRDYFDVISLLQKVKPNYKYLNKMVSIQNREELKSKLISIIKTIDFKALAKDVKPFLFNPSDDKKVKLFGEYIKQIKL